MLLFSTLDSKRFHMYVQYGSDHTFRMDLGLTRSFSRHSVRYLGFLSILEEITVEHRSAGVTVGWLLPELQL